MFSLKRSSIRPARGWRRLVISTCGRVNDNSTDSKIEHAKETTSTTATAETNKSIGNSTTSKPDDYPLSVRRPGTGNPLPQKGHGLSAEQLEAKWREEITLSDLNPPATYKNGGAELRSRPSGLGRKQTLQSSPESGSIHPMEPTMYQLLTHTPWQPWNMGKLLGQKPPLKLREIWAIRIRLQLARRARDLALFNLAIDSKLRGCDLVRLRVMDIAHAGRVSQRATVMQQKTGRPVQFEITEQTREAVWAWIEREGVAPFQFLFTSRLRRFDHISTRQYARLVKSWVA
jgi:hypothetical protein